MSGDASKHSVFLRLDAPISAFRWLQAGVYRGTFPVIPPSAAWGFALNLAGVETRGDVNEVVTPVRPDAPHLDISVGVVRAGERCTLYQQLHGYPVGSSGKELQARTKGQKYWIAPARREILVDLICLVGVRGPSAIVERISLGLSGQLDAPRYGLPFAGDNQFMFSQIDMVNGADATARWYVPVESGKTPGESSRLTTVIDRSDASRTKAPLFAPTPGVCLCPADAWVEIGPSAPAH